MNSALYPQFTDKIFEIQTVGANVMENYQMSPIFSFVNFETLK